ncbi:MAG: 3-deoxy-manno-octulosonate cytidylyltransferase [Alphaproteobacteria bacterium]|nr:3-deoxy-manno-octulosonate cytidylyltransferase [Alphaproteobacteria bacterium]MBL0717780.1 3-deoxy-manno-octulosonate cytidylyltransferase [Alphaproteobacteria bacterium]
MSKVIVLIPVRLESTRFPNKPLIEINNKSMIQHIYENVKKYTTYDVCVATGNQEIVDNVKTFNGNVVLTSNDLPSGSDRIYEAFKIIDPDQNKYDIIVNFQGDAINTRPEIITDLVELLEKTDSDITTPVMIMKAEDHNNPGCVKAVAPLSATVDEAKALYFSRAKVPHDRDEKTLDLFHHIGIYAYKIAALEKFVDAPVGVLENREKLEQLRALEIGLNIWVKVISKLKIFDNAPADIDTPEEYEAVKKVLEDKSN